jgi:putative nucleotide binding protein
MSDPASDVGETADESETRHAVVLDYLAHGRPDDDRPRYEKPALAYAVGERDFGLLEIELVDDADVSIGDRLVVSPEADRERVAIVRDVEYDDLSNAAHSELEYVVEEIVDRDERRFADFYNDAQPVSLRLHQLDLLPGIGDKLRNNVLDARKRGPFESFADLEDRVTGLHDPRQVVVDRIMDELREADQKYYLFVTPEERRGT